MRNPIFVALDVDNAEKALSMAKLIAPFVGGYKVGPRLVYKYGGEFVRSLSNLGEVFVDNKYYDIPNTMEAAVRATFAAGASFATIHAGSGPEALARMAKVESELSQQRPFRLLAVTVLTSFSENNRPSHWNEKAIPELVLSLAKEVDESGLQGLVCSPFEVAEIKTQFPHFFAVTPGVRTAQKVADDDQKRVCTPVEALNRGANALVIGRPIIEAVDPALAAREICQNLPSNG